MQSSSARKSTDSSEFEKFCSIRINEICYMVGFNNPSYFAKCFQKQFGIKPGEFVNGKDVFILANNPERLMQSSSARKSTDSSEFEKFCSIISLTK